jgi:hypothetical protein
MEKNHDAISEPVSDSGSQTEILQKLVDLLEQNPGVSLKPTPELVVFIQKILNGIGHTVEVDGDINSPYLLAELNGFCASIGRKDLMSSSKGNQK